MPISWRRKKHLNRGSRQRCVERMLRRTLLLETLERRDLLSTSYVIEDLGTLPDTDTSVAVDVNNPLLGAKGCSRVYGPQKGLRPQDMKPAEAALRRLARVLKTQLGLGDISEHGVGAAGGLGFGLSVFAGAKLKPGFDLVARQAGLKKLIRDADVVITGEGALDRQTLMGKGTGEIAVLCRAAEVPCIGLAGTVEDRKKANRLFAETAALLDLTNESRAMKDSAKWLTRLSSKVAQTLAP